MALNKRLPAKCSHNGNQTRQNHYFEMLQHLIDYHLTRKAKSALLNSKLFLPNNALRNSQKTSNSYLNNRQYLQYGMSHKRATKKK